VIIPKEFSKGDKDSYLQLTKNREYCDFLGLVQEKALSVEVLYLAKQVLKIFSSEDKYLGQAIATFKKPAHRLEFIRTIDGIRFVNDSKATNIESVIYAVNRIEGDILLIAGGKDKGLSFKEWMNHFGSKVVKVFAIGESAMKIKASLEAGYLVELCPNLEIATQKAFTCATAKSTVLLAPGCASFDSYRDYMHRGECFREIVMALKEKE
jgi:UDP-N-acetylmuramoylalanine--D-glutamate ligase